MKYMILLLLLLTGCNSSVKNPGDCFQVDRRVYRVKEVGKYSLLIQSPDGSETILFDKNERVQKVDCFNLFQ